MPKQTSKQLTPRGCMELAIEEMKKSISEPRGDGKLSPKVGAVLVKADSTVETAHRGELRYGDHAEFTLLERKNRANVLDGSTLYTTLEPCAPGARSHPKLGCAERIVNARIKKVYVGVEDLDPTVAGKGIRHLEEHHIEVEMFDRDLQQEIDELEADYKKQCIERAKEHSALIESNKLSSEVAGTDLASFSTLALQRFVERSKIGLTLGDDDFLRFLADIGVMSLDRESNTFRPTGVGILLFGKNPRQVFPNAAFKASADFGNDQVESRSFDDALVLVPDQIEEWIRKVLPASKDTSSFGRKESPVFPVNVLREAVINAIVHRDYQMEGAKSSILIDPEKIVVASPGAPVYPISIEQIKQLNAPSLSRNPVITYVFNLMGYVEETGFGMSTLRAMREKYDLPVPEIAYEEPFLSFTFARSSESAGRVSPRAGLDRLDENEIQGFEFVRLNGPVSRQDYQEAMSISTVKTAERQLKKMVDLGLVRRIGAGPATKYEVIAT